MLRAGSLGFVLALVLGCDGAPAPLPPAEDARAPQDADVCVARTCEAAGATCGVIDDGCGGTARCGECSADAECGRLRPNVCATPRWERVSYSGSTRINDIWGLAADDLWAVTDTEAILHFDGSAWSVANAGTSRRPLYGVHGRSARDAWAVGDRGLAYRFDGTRWTRVSVGPDEDLLSVHVAPGGAVRAGTPTGRILRWSGASWGEERTADADSGAVPSLWGAGDDAVFAGRTRGFLLRWDGVRWSALDDLRGVNAIDGTAADALWGVGAYATVSRWEGRVWVHETPSGLGIAHVHHAVRAFPDAVFVAGADGVLLRRRQGGSYVREAVATRETLDVLWGVASDDCWVAGDAGGLFRRRWQSEAPIVDAGSDVPRPDAAVVPDADAGFDAGPGVDAGDVPGLDATVDRGDAMGGDAPSDGTPDLVLTPVTRTAYVSTNPNPDWTTFDATFGIATREACRYATFGPWTVTWCERGYLDAQRFVHAGPITFTSGSRVVHVTTPRDGEMREIERAHRWVPGDLIGVSAAGSTNVPAFSAMLRFPQPLTGADPAPGATVTVPLDRPWTVRWDPSDDGVVYIRMWQERRLMEPIFIEGVIPRRDGSATFPLEVMRFLLPESHPDSEGILIWLYPQDRQMVRAGEWNVRVSTSHNLASAHVIAR